MKENAFHLVKPRSTRLPTCRAIDWSSAEPFTGSPDSLSARVYLPDIFHLTLHFSLKASSLQSGTAVTDNLCPVMTAGLPTPPNTQT